MKIRDVFEIDNHPMGGSYRDSEKLDSNGSWRIKQILRDEDDRVRLNVKRESGNRDATVYAEVKEEFGDIKKGLVDQFINTENLVGLTINQLKDTEIDWDTTLNQDNSGI